MDLFDFVEKQDAIYQKVIGRAGLTHDEILAGFLSYFTELEDDLEDLEVTFGTESMASIQETYINIAFLALAAAYQSGARRHKFQQAIDNIMQMGKDSQ